MGYHMRPRTSSTDPGVIPIRCERRRGPWRASLVEVLALLAAGTALTCGDPVSPTDRAPNVEAPLAVVSDLPTTCSPTTSVDLIAARTTPVGTVEMSNDDENLYVTYRTSSDQPIRKTALFVGDEASAIPTSGGGNPRVGHFPYRANHPDGTSEVIWEVALDGRAGSTVVVAAFAEVGEDREGAWAEGLAIDEGSSWATYTTHVAVECATRSIGSEGGTIDFQNLTLEVPEGALTDDVVITVTPIPASEVDAPSSTAAAEGSGADATLVSSDALILNGIFVIEGTAFHLGPEGLQFQEPVQVTIGYDGDGIPEGIPESLLRIFIVNGIFFDPGPNPELVDETARTVTTFTDHFSDFVVGGPSAAADLEVQSLVANPNPARVDDDITVDLVVGNTGEPATTVPDARAVLTLSGIDFLPKSIPDACQGVVGTDGERQIVCTTGELGPDETAAFEVILVPFGGSEFETLTVAAAVFPTQTSGYEDPDETNDTALVEIPIQPSSSADLRMKAFSPGTTAQAGFERTVSATVESRPESIDPVDATISFEFSDAGAAGLEVLADRLPSGCTWGQGSASTTINCPVGTLAPGEEASRAVVVRPLQAKTYSVSATGFPVEGDPTPDDNDQIGGFVATATVADLQASIVRTQAEIEVGGTETFSAMAQNLEGDQLPAGTLRLEIEGDSEIVAADDQCEVVPISNRSAALNCPLPQLESGQASSVFELAVRATTGGIELTGHALLLLPDYVDDPDPSNNTDKVSVTVKPENLVNFKVDQFTESADPVKPFESLTYTGQAFLASAATSPVNGGSYVLRLEGDMDVEAQSDGTCSVTPLLLDTGYEMVCPLGTFVEGEVKVYSLTVSPPTAPQTITATASVIPPDGYVETDESDNQVVETTTVDPFVADLSVSRVLDDPDPVDAGGVVRYETFAQSDGSSDDVPRAVVRFLAHGDVELVAPPSGDGITCGEVSSTLADVAVLCDVEPLRPVNPRRLTYDVRALSGSAVDVEVEIFEVSEHTVDPDPANNLQTQQTTVAASPPEPSGTLVFASNRATFNLPHLYTEDLGTGAVTRIVDIANWADPQWSPDGNRIAAARGASLWTMTATGGDQQEIVLPDRLVVPGHPTWSPDGTRIAFQAIDDFDSDQDFDIYVVDLATLNVSQLTDNNVHDESPDWSPDGNAILFSRDGAELRAIAPDGTNDVTFLDGVGPVAHPDWSPDGTRVAFSATRSAGSSIEVVSVSNPTTVTTLVNDGRINEKPAWSPDGLLVAFAKSDEFTDEEFTLWAIPADASSAATLLEGAEDDAITDHDVDWK